MNSIKKNIQERDLKRIVEWERVTQSDVAKRRGMMEVRETMFEIWKAQGAGLLGRGDRCKLKSWEERTAIRCRQKGRGEPQESRMLARFPGKDKPGMGNERERNNKSQREFGARDRRWGRPSWMIQDRQKMREIHDGVAPVGPIPGNRCHLFDKKHTSWKEAQEREDGTKRP